MSLHNSCTGNKPVITGGWGSGQAGREGRRGGQAGRAGLPASSGFGVSPPPCSLCSLCKRELLHSWKLGYTSKGRAACAACAPHPAKKALTPPAPSTPSREPPLLRWDGETEAQRPGGPVGKPARPFATSAQPNYPPPSSSVVPTLRAIACTRQRRPASVYPLTTPRETGRRAPARDTRPATRQPALPRLASPLVSGRA